MSGLKNVLLGSAAGVAALLLAAPTFADTVLIEDSGWQTDQVNVSGVPSDGSAVTFTCSSSDSPCIFSLTDAFIHGDTYSVTVNGGTTYTSALGGVNTNFDVVPNNFGPAAAFYAGPFVDPTFSHLQLTLAPGAYSLVITGDCGGGCPAGFTTVLILWFPNPPRGR